MSLCRGCGSPITWAVTTNGRMMPLDPELSTEGNVVPTGRRITTSRGQLLEVRVITTKSTGQRDLLDPDGARYYPHHATCPDAAAFRRG